MEQPFDLDSLVRSPREWWVKRARYPSWPWPPEEYWVVPGAARHFTALVVRALTDVATYREVRFTTVDRAVRHLPDDIRERISWRARSPELVGDCYEAIGEFFAAYYEPLDLEQVNAPGLEWFWDSGRVGDAAEDARLHNRTLAVLERQADSSNRSVRESAITGLRWLGTPGARQVLRECALRQPDPKERMRLLLLAQEWTAS